MIVPEIPRTCPNCGLPWSGHTGTYCDNCGEVKPKTEPRPVKP